MRQRNLAIGAALLFCVSNAAVATAMMARGNQTILVPSIVDEYAITATRVSSDYLLALTRDAASLYLNRHPYDTDYFEDNLRRLLHPSLHEALRETIRRDEEFNTYKLGRRNWQPQELCRLPGDALRTEIYGTLETYLNGKVVETVRTVRQFHWRHEGTRVFLVDMIEIEPGKHECLKLRYTDGEGQ